MKTLKAIKKIKVSYMGQPLREIYPHATWFQVQRYRFNKLMEKVFVVGLFIGVLWAGIQIGKATGEATVTHANVEVEVIKEIEIQKLAPVLERISQCESGGKHYGKSGQVILNSNTNGSVDVGLYQINSVWFAKATEMGLDITKEKDNESMAKWIYENRGTEDWYSSKSCWSK